MTTATRLLWDNELLSGTVTSSSEAAANYADDNVLNRARWKIWRSSTSTGDQWWKIDRGGTANMTAGGLIVSGHTGGSIQYQAHATDIGDGDWDVLGSPTVDEAVTISGLTGAGCVFFSSQSLRWVNIFFDNDGSANEYVEISNVFGGAYLEPTGYQIRERFSVQRVDPSSIVRALDGQEEAQQRTKFYTVAGEFPFEPEADKDSFQTMFDTVGSSLPFWLALSPSDADLQFYGRFAQPLSTNHKQLKSGSGWSIPFSFVESR